MAEPHPHISQASLLPLAAPAAATEGLLAKVTALDRLLAQAQAELAMIRAQPGGEAPVPNVRDELDAIASQTAAATDAILDACEAMGPLAASLDQPAAGRMQAATARIYEACSFHDLVGQRIRRVLSTLDTIEAAVEAILVTLGEPGIDPAVAGAAARNKSAEDALFHYLGLINSSKMPLLAIQQADVDRLMAGD